MDQKIKNALSAGISSYATIEQVDVGSLLPQLLQIFASDLPYLEKVEQLDAVFDNHPKCEALREVVFDLLLMNFFSVDVEKLESDYLESEEWEEIEEQTLDRGTELLNLLLYIRECNDEQIKPELADFLKEFLLVDDDEFQDEYRIYESLIEHQELVTSSYEEISKVSGNLDEEQEIAHLFYPMMGFFLEPLPTAGDWDEYSKNSADPGFDAAIYQIIVHYNK